MASRVRSPRSLSPRSGFSILGQVRTVSRDEIWQEALEDPYLQVYRSEKRPLSPDSITHSPSKELTFIAVSKYSSPDGDGDIRSLGRSLSTLQGKQIKELEPIKEWFHRQNMELYWSKVGSPRGIAAFEILREVGFMLTARLHEHLASVIQMLFSDDDEEGICSSQQEEYAVAGTSKRQRRERADAYRQLFGKGPFRSKKFKHGSYEDLLMYVAARERDGERVESEFTEALEAAEVQFYEEASEAGYDMRGSGYIRSKMAKFLTCERRKRNESCHPLGMKSKQIKEEIVEDIERACDSHDLGDLNEISPFIKFGCLLFRRHNHLFVNSDIAIVEN